MINTPWGIADGKEVLADGIVSYSTPSHGGIWLSAERQEQLAKWLPAGFENFLKTLKWWEEDCDWTIPYYVFREDIKASGKAYHYQENLDFALWYLNEHQPELLSIGEMPVLVN